MGPSKYAPIAAAEAWSNSEEQVYEFDQKPFRSFIERQYYRIILTLLATTSLFLLTSSILTVKLLAFSGSDSTIRFATELASASKIVRLEETSFTGGLKYDQHDVIYRELEPNQPQYVGEPHAGIDLAWNKLLSPLGMVLNDVEAGDLKGTTYREPDGSWLLTLDVYHSLHCVNLVRQAIDSDYYPVTSNKTVHRLHTDHCLDYLRQALQCSADLTPLTYLWSDSRNSRYPVFGAHHTCRDFSQVHDWATQRLGNYTL